MSIFGQIYRDGTGVVLELSRRSFETISGFQREVLVQSLDFPIYSIYFHFSLS